MLVLAIATGQVNQLGLFEGTTLALLGMDRIRWTAPVRLGDTLHTELTVKGTRVSSKPDRPRNGRGRTEPARRDGVPGGADDADGPAALSQASTQAHARDPRSAPRSVAMSEWFEDDSLWREVYPVLFPEERLRLGEEEVLKVLRLAGLPEMADAAALDLCCGPGRHALRWLDGACESPPSTARRFSSIARANELGWPASQSSSSKQTCESSDGRQPSTSRSPSSPRSATSPRARRTSRSSETYGRVSVHAVSS